MVRLLRTEDLVGAMRLKSAAGWNQTEADWLRLFEFAPEGCFGIDVGGQLAATTTAIAYGGQLAWIGMVLTAPQLRRQGLAKLLMEHALAYLRERGVRCIKLDATAMGRPLYERLGFSDECPVERWVREPGCALWEPDPVQETFDAALDLRVFGADRSRLIAALGHGRPGSEAAYFGPCVARSERDARAMLRSYLGNHAHERVFWDLLPSNPRAVEMALSHGFVPLRHLTRMRHGDEPVAWDASKVYAIAGFEFG